MSQDLEQNAQLLLTLLSIANLGQCCDPLARRSPLWLRWAPRMGTWSRETAPCSAPPAMHGTRTAAPHKKMRTATTCSSNTRST